MTLIVEVVTARLPFPPDANEPKGVRERTMADKAILCDGKNVETETVKGWAVMLRPGRYLREWDRTTDRVEGITSHPEEAFLTTKGEADRLAEANIDEGDVEKGQPKAVFVVVNTTVIVQGEED